MWRSTPAGWRRCRWWSPARGPEYAELRDRVARRRRALRSGTSDDAELAALRARRGDRARALALGRDLRPGGRRGDGRRRCPWPRAAWARCRSSSSRRALVPPGDARALAGAIERPRRRPRGGRARARAGARPLCAPEVVARALARIYDGPAPPRRARKLRPCPRPTALITGHHRPGRLVPGRAAAREGLRGHGRGARRPGGAARLLGAPARGARADRGATCSSRTRSAPRSQRVRPREVYHLAAPSFVPASWQRPGETMRAIAGSCAAILEAVREIDPRIARVRRPPPARSSARRPRARSARTPPAGPPPPTRSPSSPRTSSWARCASTTGLHASSGIVFNHESERRPEQFVTRRITRAAAAIALGLQQELTLGSLDAVRDWSFAGRHHVRAPG